MNPTKEIMTNKPKIHPIAENLNEFIYKYYYYTSDKCNYDDDDDDDDMPFYQMMLHEIIPKGYKYQKFIIHYFPN